MHALQSYMQHCVTNVHGVDVD